jgi:uncharacterized protein (DUF362 family)
MVAVMGGEPEEMFRAGIKELGGIRQFIKAGNRVVVKPNIGWDKRPELAGNTNPVLVAEIVRQCKEAGAREVIVFDHTCDECRKTYKSSGIEDAAQFIDSRAEHLVRFAAHDGDHVHGRRPLSFLRQHVHRLPRFNRDRRAGHGDSFKKISSVHLSLLITRL